MSMTGTIYHLGRGDTVLGQFSEEVIREGLAAGRFNLSDLAWCEGMSGWTPLRELPFAQEAPPPSADEALPPPVPTMVAATPLPPVISGGHVGVGGMPTPGTAVASLILGIISLITCYFGFLFAIPGVICGHLALKTIKLSGGRMEGRGLAIAGLVMSYVWLGLALILVLVFVVSAIVAINTEGFRWN